MKINNTMPLCSMTIGEFIDLSIQISKITQPVIQPIQEVKKEYDIIFIEENIWFTINI